MKNRHWLWPAVITSLLILFVAAALVFVLKSRTKEPGGARIAINHEVALRHVATLTDKQSRYSEGGVNWKDAAIMRLPTALRVRLFPHWQPVTPFEVDFGGMDPGEFRLIMRVEYPKTWLGTSRSTTIMDSVEKALDNSGMKYVRAKYGEGSYTRPDNLQVHHGQMLYDASGKVADAMPYTNIFVREVPLFVKDLELEFLPAWDENASVTQTMKLQNPCYQKVEPLPEPPPLPQTVTHDDLDVTLRALVSKTPEDTYVDFRTSGAEKMATVRSVGMALPVSQSQLPAEFFPRGGGTAEQPYHSLALFDVNQKGDVEPEWGLSDIEVFYGKPLYEWGISSWTMQGQNPMGVVGFPGDLTLANQPVKVVATFNRKNNFPVDEKQTVEVALPEEGKAVRPGASVKLWNGDITVELVSYKTKVPFLEPFSTEPDTLSVGMMNTNSFSDLREIYLVKTDGTTVSLVNRRRSGASTGNAAIFHYDINTGVSYGSSFKAPDYDECTTLGLTFIRPRDYPHKFEFTARPVDATGKWEPEE